MFDYRFYPCPSCGTKDASWDGIMFCGPCEKAYQSSLTKEFKEQLRTNPYDR